MSRLTNARQGDFPTGGTDFVSPQPTEVNIWNLDGVGNWSGDLDSRSYLRFDDANYNLQWDAGETVHEGAHHVTGSDNEIDELLGIASDGTVATEGQKFFYDGAGNLLFNGDRYFVYDAWNRLTEIHEPGSLDIDTTGVETELSGTEGNCLTIFRYDALGRKALTVTDPGLASEKTIRHLYGTGADVLVEYDVDGASESLERWFINGQSFPDPIVMVDRTGSGGTTSGTDTYYYYLKDALGSVGSLTNASGVEVELYTYSPYGKTIIYNGSGTEITESAYGNPFAWTGQRYDAANEMYHFWARSYLPEIGRWVQRDSLGPLALGMPKPSVCMGYVPFFGCSTMDAGGEYIDGLNLYQYVRGRPIILRDLLGQRSYGEIMSAVGIASVVVGMVASTAMIADQAADGLGLRFGLAGLASGMEDLYYDATDAFMIGNNGYGAVLFGLAWAAETVDELLDEAEELLDSIRPGKDKRSANKVAGRIQAIAEKLGALGAAKEAIEILTYLQDALEAQEIGILNTNLEYRTGKTSDAIDRLIQEIGETIARLREYF